MDTLATSLGGPLVGAADGTSPNTGAPGTDNDATQLVSHPTTPTSLPGVKVSNLASAGGTPQVRQVGRYQVMQMVGRGGMASVYKAFDPGIERMIAIKFLHAALCEDEQYRGRFIREARAAGMLSHTNIATVHDVGEIEGRPYIAMEFLEGDPLNDVMTDGKTFPVREVLSYGIQLARALDYAHAKGIVHRDIKPANIVRLKGGDHIKVTDFGIAHMASSSVTQHTRLGDVIGTPVYMSPEQTQGKKLDGRSDLFSAGVVLYQMLTGRRPFEGENLIALMTRIASENPPSISVVRNDVPASLRRVIERCLAKQPEKRFQTGGELAAALIRVQRELDDEATERARPRIVSLRLKWTLMMAALVATVMAVTGTFVTQRQYSAMMDQVMDDGASLSRFIALQSAVPMLSEDWVTIQVAVQETMNSQNFQSIVVIDRAGTVRAASNGALVNHPFEAPRGETVTMKGNGVTVTRYIAGSEPVLGFEAPITFRGKWIGRVELGIAERPLAHVARLSIMLMIVLVIFTVAAVALATYFVANWFSKPIKLLEESMAEVGHGRFNYRIDEKRNDEFGLLYMAFDDMAQALERRYGANPVSPFDATGTVTAVTGTVAAAPAAGAGSTSTTGIKTK
jgi:serine/threonine protein kinase/HAMP domain-containing protein